MITENDYSREIVPIQTFSLRKIRFGESVKIDFLSLLFLSDKKNISSSGVGKNWKWILILANGTCIRDYIHVMDIASGHVSALKFLLENDAKVISFNLGTGKGTSVLELANIFQIVNNVRFEIEFIERREGDIAEAVASNLFAKKKLNWEPKKSIEDMCRDGFKWQKNLIKIS